MKEKISKNKKAKKEKPDSIDKKIEKTQEKADEKKVRKKKPLFNRLVDEDYKNQIEALLYSAGKKLEVELISNITKLDKDTILKGLSELKKDYEERNSALMIIEDGTSWKIIVKEKYTSLVRKIVSDIELSKSIMETLAVIAWKSPVLQSQVIDIRTSKAYDHINELIDSGFVTKEKKGRSFILKVSEKFYNYFDVEGAQDIRQVFSRIKENPAERTLDDFSGEKKDDTLKKIGTLNVVNTTPDNSKKQAEDNMETERFGKLEVFEEEDKEETKEEEQKTEEILSEKEDEENEEVLDEVKIDEDIAEKTKKIVKQILEEDDNIKKEDSRKTDKKK